MRLMTFSKQQQQKNIIFFTRHHGDYGTCFGMSQMRPARILFMHTFIMHKKNRTGHECEKEKRPHATFLRGKKNNSFHSSSRTKGGKKKRDSSGTEGIFR